MTTTPAVRAVTGSTPDCVSAASGWNSSFWINIAKVAAMAFQARDANAILQSDGPGALRHAFDSARRETPDNLAVSAPEKAQPKDGANRTQAQLLIDIAAGDGVEL